MVRRVSAQVKHSAWKASGLHLRDTAESELFIVEGTPWGLTKQARTGDQAVLPLRGKIRH